MDAKASRISIGCRGGRNIASGEALGMSIGCCRDRNIASDQPLVVTSVHKRPESVSLGRVEQRLGQSAE